MSSRNAETGTGIISLIVILLVASLAGFFVYQYTPIFKKTSSESETGSVHKIDKSALIADLEKKIRGIPAENVAANLEGYQRLLKLAPENMRYQRKVEYYSARLEERPQTGKKRAPVVRGSYIKVGYPSPRVLGHPETGQMVGRVEAGSLVEVLDSTVIAAGSLPTTWYQIRYGKGTAWLSKLGTTGPLITKPAAAEKTAEEKKPSDERNPWEKLAATMIDDYGGKIVSIDRLDIHESHFSLFDGMTPEQVRQTSENIGYYIRNTTGESPIVVALVSGTPVARAEPAGTKYQAKLITK